MHASDLLDFLIGVSWAIIALPYIRWAWILSERAFEPFQSSPALWARVGIWLLLAMLYCLMFSCFAVMLSLKMESSNLSWNPMPLGVLVGLVILVIAIRSKKK
jgi:hypothetical protein